MRYTLVPRSCLAAILAAALAACGPAEPPAEQAAAPADETAAQAEGADYTSGASPDADQAAGMGGMGMGMGMEAPAQAAQELPVRLIPNVPETAEAYYAPDSYHVIAQTQDPDAQKSDDPNKAGGALTYIFTDDGAKVWRVNDRGQDACSWFFPDQKRIVWTSTRDNMDMPLGDWSDEAEYPQGAELYISDLEGKNVVRLTNNKYYEAEVTVSPKGDWIVFGRQIDGKMDIWKIRPDGTDEQQLTFTEDWQEGAPYFLPDNQTIIFRAWKRSVKQENDRIREETGERRQTPMTIFTMKADGSDVQPRTFTDDMNWAPFPAPDGQHFVYVRIVEGNNWEVFLGDLAGGEPQRLTFNPSFDGFPSISPDGKKMLFTRSDGKRFMSGLKTYVMDISSLNIGPEWWTGTVPPVATPPEGDAETARLPDRPAEGAGA